MFESFLILCVISLIPSSYGLENQVITKQSINNQTIINVNVTVPENDDNLISKLIDNGLVTTFSIVGTGLSAIVIWFRRRGIPPFNEQEKIVTELTISKLEEQLELMWSHIINEIQENNKLIEYYWQSFGNGTIPQESYENLLTNVVVNVKKMENERSLNDYFKGIEISADKLVERLFVQVFQKYQKSITDETVDKIVKISVNFAYDQNDSLRYWEDFDELVSIPLRWLNDSLIYMKPLIIANKLLIREENLVMLAKIEIAKSLKENPPIAV